MGFLAQLKAQSFLAGLATAGALYISTRRLLWTSTATTADSLPGSPPQPQPLEEPERLFGPLHCAFLIRKWNQAVDATCKPLVAELSKRGL